MRDKRPVDELSIEELERVLAIKRREEREKGIRRMQQAGRRVTPSDAAPVESVMPAPPPEHDPVAAALAALTQPDYPTAPLIDMPPPKENLPVQEDVYPGNAAPAFDEGEAPAPPKPRSNPRERQRQRRLIDRVLMLVEVGAVLGLVIIAINLFTATIELERETASAQALADEQRRLTIPTIAPTATVRLENVVLPGGHILVNGVPQFNYQEVPSHLVPLVESQWIQPPISRPPRTSETALSIVIPQIGINGTVVQGVDVEALKQGVGQIPNGINPGDDFGNVVLAAHNDIYGQLFRRLDELQPGDEFTIQTETRIHTYRVTEQHIVLPSDVWVLENRQGATATLISCYPYQVNTQRIIVFADRIS